MSTPTRTPTRQREHHLPAGVAGGTSLRPKIIVTIYDAVGFISSESVSSSLGTQ
ncbi:hypothetical protein [Nocardia gipuzkoensis]